MGASDTALNLRVDRELNACVGVFDTRGHDTLTHPPGKAVWTLDSPAALRAEAAQRAQAAAEAASRKLEGALDRKVCMGVICFVWFLCVHGLRCMHGLRCVPKRSTEKAQAAAEAGGKI